MNWKINDEVVEFLKRMFRVPVGPGETTNVALTQLTLTYVGKTGDYVMLSEDGIEASRFAQKTPVGSWAAQPLGPFEAEAFNTSRVEIRVYGVLPRRFTHFAIFDREGMRKTPWEPLKGVDGPINHNETPVFDAGKLVVRIGASALARRTNER